MDVARQCVQEALVLGALAVQVRVRTLTHQLQTLNPISLDELLDLFRGAQGLYQFVKYLG